MNMDLLAILTTMGTGMFLIPIINEYQQKTAVLSRSISNVMIDIQVLEETILEAKAEVAESKCSLDEATREMSEVERERAELQQAVESKTKKKR